VRNLKNNLIYGEIIKIMMEAYFEFLISGYLAYNAGIMTTDGEVISTLLSYLVLIISLILMPFTLLWLLFKPLSSFKNPYFIRKYGNFFDEISNKRKS
tara:strand:- start:229 stop:522 length:294 start_codon:yes stop_codon:yes gene_type:complete